MKCALFIILSCLILAGSASAIQEPVSAPLNQDISVAASAAARPALLVVPCSDDPFPNGSFGVIWMKNWTNGGWSDCPACSLKIDGAAPHNWGWTFGFFSSFESQYKFFEEPGTHSYQVTTSTGTETGTIRVCEDKITYLYSNKPSPVVTTPTTAAVTGTETTLPVTTVTIAPAVSAETTGETTAPTGVPTQEITNPPATAPAGSATAQPDTYGALSITTTPAGAFIFINGVQRGVSPATIPGLPAGIHTLLLKLDGYQDLSTPVTITAGTTQDYTTALAKNTETGTTRSPGFEFVCALCALGALLRMRTRS
jgi:hypothetical protein